MIRRVLTKAVHPYLQALVTLTALGLAIVYGVRYGSMLRDASLTINGLELSAGMLILLLGMSVLPSGAVLIYRSFPIEICTLDIWRMVYTSSLAKYLPGGIWALPGRVVLTRQAGISNQQSIALMAWEVITMTAAAALIGFLCLPLIVGRIPGWLIALAAGGFASWLCAVIFSRALITRLGGALIPLSLTLAPYSILRVIACYAAVWGVFGLSFALIVRSISPVWWDGGWAAFTGLYAWAWLVGFVAFFAPGGIGVRDGLILLGLSMLPTPVPAGAALLARLGWTSSEVVCYFAVQMIWRLHVQRRSKGEVTSQ